MVVRSCNPGAIAEPFRALLASCKTSTHPIIPFSTSHCSFQRTHFALAGRAAKSRAGEVSGPRPYALRTTTASYDVRSALVGPGVLGRGPMAVVVIERTTPGRRALEGLAIRFQLTPREVAVAQLLAEGRSNQQMARLLDVSIHTARRHVEHVLMKLGVHSRAAVGARLRDGDGERNA